MRALLAALLLASPAWAETPLTADDFDALTQGRNLAWSKIGSVYGLEQYLPDRRVRWSAVDQDCKTGHWYPEGPAICFQYEGDSQPDCWIITRSGTGFTAHYTLDAPEAPPVTLAETPEAPACFGPEIGT